MRATTYLCSALLALLFAMPVCAVPRFVTYSARLDNSLLWGKSAVVTLSAAIYRCECPSSSICTHKCAPNEDEPIYEGLFIDVPIVDGYFTIQLGMCDATGICSTDPSLAGFPAELPPLAWLELSVDQQPPMSPRIPIGSVPYALHAAHCDNSSSTAITASNGNTYSQTAIYKQTTKGLSGGSFTDGTTPGRIEFAGHIGYRAAKLACEAALNSPTAHMCTTHEIVVSAQLGVTISLDGDNYAWVATGSSDQLQQGYLLVEYRDCRGFTNNNTVENKIIAGVVWKKDGWLSSSECNIPYTVACCDTP